MSRTVLVAPLALLALACSADQPVVAGAAPAPAPAADVDVDVDDTVDTDGDGLTDVREAALGTSPLLADTDGDGLTDGDEVIRFGFDPAIDATRFHPLVADMPQLDVQVVSAPTVTVFGTSTTGESVSYGVSNSSEVAQSYSTSTSTSTANSVENTTEWDVEASVSFSLTDFGGGASSSYGESETYGTETTVSYGSDYTSESSQAYEQSSEASTFGEVTLESAALAVTVDVENAGHLAYTIASLTLSARHRDVVDSNHVVPVGSLVAADLDGWAGLSQAPGEAFRDIVFRNDELSWQQGQDLLADPSGLVLSVSSYELLDGEGRSYALNGTDVASRTARVTIDFGPDREPMDLQVATNASVDENGLPMGLNVLQALDTVLGLQPRIANDQELTLAGFATNLSRREAWRVTSSVREAELGEPLANWTLRAGDELHLVWLDDTDGDELFSREEAILGTDNDRFDSDDDGVSDFDEVRILGTDAAVADTDGDTVLDGAEVDMGTDPLHVDTDGDDLTDGEDARPITFDERVARSASFDLDGSLEGVDNAYVASTGQYASVFGADRMGREGLALLIDGETYFDVDNVILGRIDNGYGDASYEGGVSMWVRFDTLPSDTDFVGYQSLGVQLDSEGRLTVRNDGALVAELGDVELGVWTHVVLGAEARLTSGNQFFAWRDGVAYDTTTPFNSYNLSSIIGWFHGGHGDSAFALDHVVFMSELPTDVQRQQLANEGAF